MRPLLLCSLILISSVVAQDTPDPSPGILLEEAKRVQVEDIESWSRFQFRRQVRRDVLDADGKVTDSELLDFRVVPVDGDSAGSSDSVAFDEELLRIDRRAPTASEVERHRRRGSFAKHYRRLVSGTNEEGAEEGFSLGYLLRMTGYRYLGVEVVDGVTCHRLDFSPAPEGQGRGIAGRFAESLSGSIWLTVDGLHLYKAKAGTVKPISIALSLFKIHDFKVEMLSGPVNEKVWLPRRIKTETSIRVITKTTRRKNLYTYSDFVSFDDSSEESVLQAAHGPAGGA